MNLSGFHMASRISPSLGVGDMPGVSLAVGPQIASLIDSWATDCKSHCQLGHRLRLSLAVGPHDGGSTCSGKVAAPPHFPETSFFQEGKQTITHA